MQKLHVLRAFVEQRLSDVTDDIFRRFAATIVEYELEVQRLKLELEAAGAPGAGPEGGPEGGPEETPSGVLHVFTEEEKQQARGRGFSLHIKEEEGGASGPEDIDITSSPFPEAELHPADSQQEVLGVKQEVEDDHMMLEAAVRAEVISQQEGVLQIFTREEEQRVKGRSLSLQIKQEEGGASGSETSPESLMESDDDEGSSSPNQIQTFEEAKLLSSDLLRPEPGGTCRSPGSRTGPPDQNLLVCNSCGREFSSRRILQKHIRQNSAQNQNQNQMSCSLRRQRTTNYCSCRVCGSSFNTQGILVRHAQNHCKEPETRCGACGDVLESTECLREHLQSHKDAGSTCDVCGKKWSSIRRMEIHKRVHTGEKPYHCSLCSLDFSRKESLVRHLRMHSGDRPHHCGLCRRTFTRREYLVQHLRMVHIDTPEPAPEN